MKRTKTVLALLLALVLCAALFAGCGQTPAESSAPAESSEAPAESSEAPAESSEAPAESSEAPAESTEASGGGDYSDVSVVFIPKLLNNYFDTLNLGFEEAAAELGFSYEYKAPASGEATSQVEYLEAAIQNQVDVICISPNSNDALNTYFDDAREAGIEVFVINQELDGYTEHRDLCVLQTDMSQVGISQAELIGELMDYEGQWAIMSASTDTPDQNFWIETMETYMADNPDKFGNMELVEIAYGDEEPEKTTTEAEALLTKYPDLKGIVAPTAVGLPLCAQVVETKGLSGQIAVTGLAMPSDMAAYVDSGTVTEFQLWNPTDEGYLASYIACQVAGDGMSTDPGTTYDGGRLGSDFTVNDEGQVILGPLFSFTAENVHDFNF